MVVLIPVVGKGMDERMGHTEKKMKLSLAIKACLVRSQNNAQKSVPTISHTVILVVSGRGNLWDSGSLGKAGQDSAGFSGSQAG